ncbi:MAG TPA: FHA domain-containing protein [Longimicrobiales bacterium]|nr:FHA domain-containing protein [Longimicrobiales bacterium]
MSRHLLINMIQSGAPGSSSGVFFAIALLVIAAVAIFAWYRRRRAEREHAEAEQPLPPLIFSLHSTGATHPAPAPERFTDAATTAPADEAPPLLEAARDGNGGAPGIEFAPVALPPTGPVGALNGSVPEEAEPPAGFPAQDASVSLAESSSVSAGPTGGSSTPDAAAPLADVSAVTAGRVRYHMPPEGTLQLLPGRLEVVEGRTDRGEIRFVRLSGDEPVVTFGRAAGEPLAHIQLEAATVSRLHARMNFRDGSWHIANLSHTNPVAVNGAPLGDNGDSAELKDGDVLEMGEVVFRYRMP